VSRNDTRQSRLCRVSIGQRSTKNSKIIFVECRPWDTRQRRLCRVPPIWHSAKRILKLKKNLCRVPDHGHSAKHSYIAPGQFFFLPLSLRRVLCSTPPPCPRRAAPSLSATSPTAVPSLPSPARRALARSPPKCTPGKCTRSTSNPRVPSFARDPPSRPRPNLQGDCLLSFCDIVIKKLYVLHV
jgi:hypothetical protein